MISERAKIIRELDAKWNKLAAKRINEAYRQARITTLQEMLDTIREYRERGWEKGNILETIIGRLYREIRKGGD